MENTEKCRWRKGREAVNKWRNTKEGWDLDDSYDHFQKETELIRDLLNTNI